MDPNVAASRRAAEESYGRTIAPKRIHLVNHNNEET
jgi:hypothetical protein